MKRIITLFVLAFLLVILAIWFVTELVFGIRYARVTSGIVNAHYMDKVFIAGDEYYKGSIETMTWLAKNNPYNDGNKDKASINCSFYLVKEFGKSPLFVSYSLVHLPSVNQQEHASLLSLGSGPLLYRVIDIYKIKYFSSSEMIAICAFCNVNGFEDIIFRRTLPNELLLRTLEERGEVLHEPINNKEVLNSCPWDKERYELVISSSRCRLRKEIIKHIAPGDRTEPVSGYWWNF